MAALKQITSLTKAFKAVAASRTTQALVSKNFYTYSKEPAYPIPDKEPCWVKSAEEALQQAGLTSEQKIYIQGAAATPTELCRGMTEVGKSSNVKNVKLYHMHLEGEALFAAPENEKHFKSISLFIGGNVRKAVNEGRADCIPIFLHEIPRIFNDGVVKPDMALIHVSPPDEQGYCSLGTSVDSVRSAVVNAKVVVAQVNKHMPRTFGDAVIHQSHIDVAVKHDTPLPQHKTSEPSKEEVLIGKHIAENLVVNGATLQLGIGSIPDAVLSQLKNHKDLGIHSEMFADGIVDLVNRGCITNNHKSMHQGRTVGSFCVGTQKLYDYMHNNPTIEMLRVDYVNDPRIVCQQAKMTAINSCIEVDITGQISSDSIGTRMYSGFGGQLDFIFGAAMATDGCGKPIIALRSTTNKGASKISPVLQLGAGVVTSRAHVRYVVTEHGIASLFGKTLQQRAHALIQVAHPNHRESLEKAAFERLKMMPEP
ncbi:4-hydroxybutyrate coenzyme A transferase [Leptopilina heterotoma]|uniref:4-hydroxybutyrate coenzyme A transferase n=1 Tax=Leptopilina heterotoma TaxID=63436 RepID=UPI001CA8A0ED|nr:4-hydroxybutyrate coenzyme A transferase [Leptopilina heterotoma]